jgi:hypothetical protein
MSRSREELRRLVDQVLRRLPKHGPMPAYQKAILWVLVLGALFLVLEVVFSR